MTVMEADESDEYLKIVCAPQLLKFFNISNQIHSMYQLMQLQYRSYPILSCVIVVVDNIRKNMAALTSPNRSWQVDYLVSGCSYSTSLPLFLLTTSHPSTQISANAC